MRLTLVILSLLLFCPYLRSQLQGSYKVYFFTDTVDIDPALILIRKIHVPCFDYRYVYADTTSQSQKENINNSIPKKPFLTVHGNIYYDVFYQSNIDTPFYANDLYQHTIRTYLDIGVRGGYPLRLSFTQRFSNSPLFKNFTGIGLQFDPQNFKTEMVTRLQQFALQQLRKVNQLDSIEKALQSKLSDIASVQNRLLSPSVLQSLIEEKERQYLLTHPNMDALQQTQQIKEEDIVLISGRDTLDSNIQKFKKDYAAMQLLYDSLNHQLLAAQEKYHIAKTKFAEGRELLSAGLSQYKNPHQLLEKLQELAIPDSALPKGYKALLALRSLGIGRSTVNYSELSAKNVSITGLQVEYNPKYYFAFAAGSVDYLFREYILNTANFPKQYLTIGRIGKGQKDADHLIFTYFAGKKQLYNSTASSESDPSQLKPDFHLVGFTLEARKQLNKNSYILAEIGKSSLPYFTRDTGKEAVLASAFHFNDHSNEAYSVRLVSYLPATKTRIDGTYRHIGANYQSFSLFTTSSTQNAYALRVDQSLFKNELGISASIRKNDFISPYLINNYSTNTVFKSIQATVRIKKLPVITAGYFPSSQLVKINDETYSENLFYTLSGSLSYSYSHHLTFMNTLISFTRFYNHANDSGFVYFNTTNFLVNQTIYFRKFSLGLIASGATNTSYALFCLGGNMQCKLKSWISVGGGLKYNYQTVFENRQLGYSVNGLFKIFSLGQIQLLLEKGFIPGINSQLVKNNIGRLIYFKEF